MTQQPSVTVQGLGKCYRIYPDSRSRVMEALFMGKKKYHAEKWALRDIDFELWPGQALGIIGFNGAGKSTLLKILTGTSQATTGSYEVNGVVSSLLELGAGFHPEFSGKQNIYMNASILGVTKAKVDEMYDEIAEFSELGEYLDRPVRTYSSGMAMRLGFSAAMVINPDVLILDEVLAVGDIHFQQKCMDKFNELRTKDKTILFVSHSVYHIREICDRCIWIHEGRMVMDGDPVAVTDEYETRMLELHHKGELEFVEGLETKKERAQASLGDCEMTDEAGQPCREFKTRDVLKIRMPFHNPVPDKRGLYAAVAFHRNDGLMVFGARPDEPTWSAAKDNEIVLTIPSLRLLAGEYTASIFLTDHTGTHLMDQRRYEFRFKVHYPGPEKGLFLHDCKWESHEAKGADS